MGTGMAVILRNILAGMEAGFTGFPQGWKQMLRDLGCDGKVMRFSSENEDAFHYTYNAAIDALLVSTFFRIPLP